MRRVVLCALGLALGGLGAATATAQTAQTAQKERCGTCHPASRVAHEKSVHAREGVACADCHGGDPTALEVAPAHRGSFRALDDRRAGPAVCAECHADLEQMRPYNLPIDQFALYQTSSHGRALASGDLAAAICSDCHGAHEIRAPDDPISSTHPLRISGTCESCHGDTALADRYGWSPDLVSEYRSSVHGQALLAGVAAAPNCTSCHGVHGAGPPGIGSLDKVCGGCHEAARKAFIAGPHQEGMRSAGLSECASCHSNHATVRLGAEATTSICQDCHGGESDAANLGVLLHESIATAREEVDEAQELVLEGSRMAIDTEDHLARLEEARSYLTEVLPVVHAVALEPVESLTRRARSIGEEVKLELHEELDRTPQRLGLLLLWFYVLMTVAILVGSKRRLLRQADPQ